MIGRLATVIWWISALLIAVGALLSLNSIFNPETSNKDAWLICAAFMILPGLAGWGLAFVLGGSFFRPAIGPLSRS